MVLSNNLHQAPPPFVAAAVQCMAQPLQPNASQVILSSRPPVNPAPLVVSLIDFGADCPAALHSLFLFLLQAQPGAQDVPQGFAACDGASAHRCHHGVCHDASGRSSRHCSVRDRRLVARLQCYQCTTASAYDCACILSEASAAAVDADARCLASSLLWHAPNTCQEAYVVSDVFIAACAAMLLYLDLEFVES